MNSQHTPGPWEVENLTKLAEQSWFNIMDDRGFVVAEAIKDRATACLIAAAPDMLAALKELLKAADFIGSGVVDWAKWIDDARALANAAIDKAEGRAE